MKETRQLKMGGTGREQEETGEYETEKEEGYEDRKKKYNKADIKSFGSNKQKNCIHTTY